MMFDEKEIHNSYVLGESNYIDGERESRELALLALKMAMESFHSAVVCPAEHLIDKHSVTLDFHSFYATCSDALSALYPNPFEDKKLCSDQS